MRFAPCIGLGRRVELFAGLFRDSGDEWPDLLGKLRNVLASQRRRAVFFLFSVILSFYHHGN